MLHNLLVLWGKLFAMSTCLETVTALRHASIPIVGRTITGYGNLNDVVEATVTQQSSLLLDLIVVRGGGVNSDIRSRDDVVTNVTASFLEKSGANDDDEFGLDLFRQHVQTEFMECRTKLQSSIQELEVKQQIKEDYRQESVQDLELEMVEKQALGQREEDQQTLQRKLAVEEDENKRVPLHMSLEQNNDNNIIDTNLATRVEEDDVSKSTRQQSVRTKQKTKKRKKKATKHSSIDPPSSLLSSGVSTFEEVDMTPHQKKTDLVDKETAADVNMKASDGKKKRRKKQSKQQQKEHLLENFKTETVHAKTKRRKKKSRSSVATSTLLTDDEMSQQEHGDEQDDVGDEVATRESSAAENPLRSIVHKVQGRILYWILTIVFCNYIISVLNKRRFTIMFRE